ncbi:hypothetical protein C2R22_20955 [Salinigranum rubrum]|uniref:Stage II sporulation protein M n=1 Tax=Salinigranum rubrum TaxID=755307 RepID=A0A2I8VPE1_9EURY|nr:stage II sporulation protein M [Salinigranum rubrum]AUV83810.1 hypothetical protein C2R22_20955 [Salinigranum rubrum]
MSVDDALRSAGGVLRRQTSTVLPYYALVAATGDVTRLPMLVGVVVALVALASTGRLEPLLDDLASVNPELLAPDSPASLPPAVGERLAAVLFSPTVVVPLVLAFGLALLVSVLASGVTRAAALSAVDAALDERDPLDAGVAGMRRWKTFAGLVVVRWALLLAAGIPLLAAVVGGAGALGGTTDPAALDQGTVVAVLAAVVGGLVTLFAVVTVFALLAFAGPAAVVDDRSLVGAVRRSAGVPFAHPVGFLLYGVVVVGSYVALAIAAGLFGIAGVSRLVTVSSAFLVSPLLDGVAVSLYAGWTEGSESGESTESDGASESPDESGGSDASDESNDERVVAEESADESGFVFGADGTATGSQPSPETERGIESTGATETGGVTERAGEMESGAETAGLVAGVRGALTGGVRELGTFLRAGWGYVVVSAATLLVGIAGGWTATVDSGVSIDPPADPASVFGVVPVGPFVNLAVNNWFVATTAGFSGLFGGVPTLGTLLFNGALVGAVAGVVDPVTFIAFVGPHGIIELPAIAVAGGVGLRLGHVAWGVWRGTRAKSALADELGRTWRLVVGLLVVFVVAGFVEAFVTPQVAAAVLG